MILIQVVHCKKFRGNHEYIGRPSPLGNPFIFNSKSMKKGDTLNDYELWLREKISKRDKLVCDELNRLYKIAKNGELNLSCWCSPQKCHGDIIKKILQEKLY